MTTPHLERSHGSVPQRPPQISPITLALNPSSQQPTQKQHHHQKCCLHTYAKSINPSFIDRIFWHSSQAIDKLFWHSSRTIKYASQHFLRIHHGLDQMAYGLSSAIENRRHNHKLSKQKQLHSTHPKCKPTSAKIRCKKRNKQHSGFFLLYTTLLGIFSTILSKLYHLLPTFIHTRLDPILTFLKRQPLYQYYVYSLYHAPGVLFMSLVINYIVPIIMEMLPWYFSRRHLSKTIRDERALLQQHLINPVFNLLGATGGAGGNTGPTASATKTPGAFPSHLLYRNAPPPPPSTPLPAHLAQGQHHVPNIWLYTAKSLWYALLNQSLINLRVWADVSSRSTIKHLALHTLLSRYEVPNNGNGNQYFNLSDPMGPESLFIASNHANFLIPNIIQQTYTLYHDAKDLYNEQFSFNTFPFALLIQPLLTAMINETLSIISTQIQPPPVVSSSVNSHNFFSTVSNSMSEIKALNLYSYQYDILERINAQDRLDAKVGPWAVLNYVLSWMQFSGFVDDISRSAVASLMTENGLPMMSDVTVEIAATYNPTDATRKMTARDIVGQFDQEGDVPTPPPLNLSDLISNNNNTTPLTNKLTPGPVQINSILSTTPPSPQQTTLAKFLFGGINNSDSYVVIYRELVHLTNLCGRIYSQSLEVLGFMLNQPELPQLEVMGNWDTFFESVGDNGSNDTLKKDNNITHKQHIDCSLDDGDSSSLSSPDFYTFFNSITINSISYTYPEHQPIMCTLPQYDSEFIYSKVNEWIKSWFTSIDQQALLANGSMLEDGLVSSSTLLPQQRPIKQPALSINNEEKEQSFLFQRGKIYLCCGVNTSGKSTLAQVLARFLIENNPKEPSHYGPNLNKIDLSLEMSMIPTEASSPSSTLTIPFTSIPLQHYRKHVLYLKQKPFIFNATLIDNITGADHTYHYNNLSPTQLSYSNRTPLFPLTNFNSDPGQFLSQYIPCVCGCDCGLEHCGKASMKPNQKQFSKQIQSSSQSCNLTMKWLCWSMFMAGLYNDRGELDSEFEQQQQQQNSNLNLSQHFQTTTRQQRRWVNDGTDNGSFINRLCCRFIGFNPLSRWTESKDGKNSQNLHCDDDIDCDCQCQCRQCRQAGCVEDTQNDQTFITANLSSIPSQSQSTIPSTIHTSTISQSTIPNDPKVLWESINNIVPLTQQELMAMSCEDILTSISQRHPLLAFPSIPSSSQPSLTSFTHKNDELSSQHDILNEDSKDQSPNHNEKNDNISIQPCTVPIPLPLLPPQSLLEIMITNNGGNISGGFAQSIALARMFIRPHTQYIILDESLSMMDFAKFNTVFPRIIAFARAIGAAVIIISHHLRHIVQHSDYVVFMERGNIVLFDDPKNPIKPSFSSPGLQDLYQTLMDS